MEELADVSIRPSQNVIERENDSRRIDVDGEVPKGHDLGAVMRAVEDRVEKIKFPLGYHAEILGEYAERQEAQNRLMLFFVVAAIGVFFVLLASFGNGRLAFLAFLILPSALVGGLLAAFATGGIITLGSLVGLITVFGIVARNGIMMINHFQHLEAQEGEQFGPRLVMRGARERLAPILMTACTTGLALVPMVVAGNVPGHEIEYPMAIVIMGGLVTSTLLNLFVVPSLYLKFGRSKSNMERVQTA
jgi:Cu/Ag efflux pump CusA